MRIKPSVKREVQALIASNNYQHARRKKIVSNATLEDRANFMHLAFRQLHEVLHTPIAPAQFKGRHATALMQLWERQGLSAATLQKRFSYLRQLSRWLGKDGMLHGGVSAYLKDPVAAERSYVAKVDRTWSGQGIDWAQLIAQIHAYDAYVGAQLTLERELGLRAKEAIMCRPWESDKGNHFEISHGSKGGRPRTIPIDTSEKRSAVDLAQSLVSDPSQYLGSRGNSLRQNISRYYYVLRKFGVTRNDLGVTGHGLRHEYANELYGTLAGQPSPLHGGLPVPTETDSAARLSVAKHLGHGRRQITSAYLGGVLTRAR